jgi:mannosylglycerate hydrolase
MTPTYHIVSHSHWDREWYKSFEEFRAMLVNMVDDLLDLMERDREFRCFTLDGQTVILEDYCAIRPERREDLRRMVAQGRIVTGPWYVLPDEFLVSAEATVRNLLAGTQMARQFGGLMKVGYIPDSFGHIAMMPAILKGFGIDAALVYRGFGGEPEQKTSEYWWKAPDGTRALLVHLYRNGYSAGYFHEDSDEQMAEHFAVIKKELDERATTKHRLLMNGGDHHWPDPKLPATLRILREKFDGTFEHSTVQRYVDAVRKEVNGLPEVEGELRFGYRYAFAVMGGVYSSRMYIKQANWRAQNLLQRYVEPLNAMALATGMRTQSPLVRHAWKTLMKNHPHDSICGCSVDTVHREMLTRFAAVEQAGGSVMDVCLDRLVPPGDSASHDDRFLFLFNPSPFRRTEIVQGTVNFYLQDVIVGLNPDVVVHPKRPPVKGFALVDGAGTEIPYQILRREEGYDITYSNYNYPKQTLADCFTLLVDARDIPPVGFKGLRVEKRKKLPRYPAKVTSGRSFLENDFLRVEVNGHGEVKIGDKVAGTVYRGLNVFEDSGDVGDEYNYSYPKKDARITSSQFRATIQRIENGPLRAALAIDMTLRLPASAAPGRKSRSTGTVPFHVRSVVSLTPYSRAVHFETTVENTVRDHRFRVLFPADIATNRSTADSQFCVVEREQKEYDTRQFTIEHPAQVAPMQRYVTVRGTSRALSVLAYGLPEYELKRDGRGTIALTLLRCIGLLAGDDLLTRPGGKAGWHNETPDAQCPGTHIFRYAALPHAPDEPAASVLLMRESERFHLPVLPLRRKNDKQPPLESSFVSLTEGPLTLSAIKESEDGEGIILRVYNPTGAPAEGILRFDRPLRRAFLTRLDEQPSGPLEVTDGSAVAVAAPPFGIVTVKVQHAGGRA